MLVDGFTFLIQIFKAGGISISFWNVDKVGSADKFYWSNSMSGDF